MSLRAAEQLMPTSPEAALALIAEARETSSRALADLRDLVRGIYPPVLADRGLADAVRTLALDTPMTVDTDITLSGEPPMPIAAAVYFGIAEILTNAVRHSGADKVEIGIGHAGGLLRATVADDGVGGADPANGTGLTGVERRLAAFDGILAVSSPPGGPTHHRDRGSVRAVEHRRGPLPALLVAGKDTARRMMDSSAHPMWRTIHHPRRDRGLPCASSSVKTSSCCGTGSCGCLRRTGSRLSRPWGALPNCSRRSRS